MTYAISDIHGNYDKFLEMLEEINFKQTDTMYILGDVVDRGNKSIECLLYIMSKSNIHMLLGNHEEFMLDYFKRNKKIPNDYEINQQIRYEIWFRNGGIKTIESMKNFRGQYVINDLIEYLKSLPLTINISVGGEYFVLAHANIMTYKGFEAHEQSKDLVLWDRRMPSDNDLLNNFKLVAGHTPTRYFGIDDKIFNHLDWYCIDCGCVFYGTLGCLRLDDMTGFYV